MTALLTNIGTIMTSMLAQMTAVLAWVIDEPVVLFYLAIPLVGLVFKWVRRMAKGF